MPHRFTLAALFLLALTPIHLALRRLPAPEIPQQISPREIDLRSTETRLALGMRLRFQDLSQYDFELISGISDVLAKKLIELQPLARTGSIKQFRTQLLAVHGIGEKRAKRFIELFYIGRSEETLASAEPLPKK